MELTKEQAEILERNEQYLHTAYYADYTVGLPRKNVEELFELHNTIFPRDRVFNKTCGACVLSALKRLGGIYYQQKRENAPQGEKTTKRRQQRRKD